MYSLLVLTRPSPLSDDIFKGLTRQYHVAISPVEWTGIDLALGSAQYDLVLIYANEPSAAELGALRQMFSHPDYGKIPLVVIGTHS